VASFAAVIFQANVGPGERCNLACVVADEAVLSVLERVRNGGSGDRIARLVAGNASVVGPALVVCWDANSSPGLMAGQAVVEFLHWVGHGGNLEEW
jgi:hypothetical protein